MHRIKFNLVSPTSKFHALKQKMTLYLFCLWLLKRSSSVFLALFSVGFAISNGAPWDNAVPGESNSAVSSFTSVSEKMSLSRWWTCRLQERANDCPRLICAAELNTKHGQVKGNTNLFFWFVFYDTFNQEHLDQQWKPTAIGMISYANFLNFFDTVCHFMEWIGIYSFKDWNEESDTNVLDWIKFSRWLHIQPFVQRWHSAVHITQWILIKIIKYDTF